LAAQAVRVAMAWPSPSLKFAIVAKLWTSRLTAVSPSKLKSFPAWSPNSISLKAAQAEVAMTVATAAAVVVPSVVAVALVATAAVTVLNHAARLALKATVVATVLKTVALLHRVLKVVLKVAVISVPKAASNPVVIFAANNAALPLAVAKVALSPVAISAQTTVAVTASKRVTTATAVPLAVQAHLAVVTMPVAAQVIASRPVAPRSLVLATSSPTTPADTQHPSALALKC
jgi:hypothetical protein